MWGGNAVYCCAFARVCKSDCRLWWGLMDKRLMACPLPDSRKWVWGNSRGSHMWCWFFGGCDMAAGGWGSLYAKRGNKFCQMSPRATDSETRLLPSTQEFPVSKHGNSKRKSCGAVWSFSMSWSVYLMNVLETHTHTHTHMPPAWRS